MPLVSDSVSEFSLWRRARGQCGGQAGLSPMRRFDGCTHCGVVMVSPLGSAWCRQWERPRRVNRTLHEEVPAGSPVVMIAVGEPEVARALVLGGDGTMVVGAPLVGEGRGQHLRGTDGL